jgi:hypothetical protein
LIDFGLDGMAVTEIVKRTGKSIHGIESTTAIEILEVLLFFHDKSSERLLIF